MKLKIYQILLPIIIGLGVVVWLFVREFDNGGWQMPEFGEWAAVGFMLAMVAVVGRDFGLTWRFHHLSYGDLSWRQSLKVCLLCEFTSAITPTAVGGSAFSLYFMNREGLSLGRSTTLMMTTLFFDELIFVVMCPLVLSLVPYDELLCLNQADMQWLAPTFWTVYALIVAWTMLLFVGTIIAPQAVTAVIKRLFGIRLLKRWKSRAESLCRDMLTTSAELRHQKIGWWVTGFCSTTVSWLSRFLLVNAIIFALLPSAPQLLTLCRQFAVWLVLMFAPTPGGAGLSEGLFMTYYADVIPSSSVALSVTIVWRLMSYYIYLVVGLFMLPSLFRKNSDTMKSVK